MRRIGRRSIISTFACLAVAAWISAARAQPEPAPESEDAGVLDAAAPEPVDAAAPPEPVDAAPPPPDAEALPFALADEKKLDEEELAGKKEGVFVTGVPDFSSDPLNGIGLGLEGYLTYDGSRKDPFFAYTPYRSRLSVAAFVTTKNQQAFELGFDAPYVFDSPWRLRTVTGYANDPNQLYFGTTAGSSTRHLRSLYPAASQFAGHQVGSFDSYEDNLATVRAGGPGEAPRVADNFYNYFILRQGIMNVSAERSLFSGLLRLVAGFEVAYVDVETYDGRHVDARDPVTGTTLHVPNARTRLSEDSAAGKIRGLGHGFVDIAQVGLVYDTRDFEPDPTRGIFAEVTNELSFPEIGSRFTFDKLFGHVKGYQKIFSYRAQRLVVAGRLGLGYTFGPAPFFEFQDEWSTEGSIEGLGGFHTLRGYKQARFLARMIGFGNLELRYRFARFSLLKQDFALMVVPFVDTGGVWNRPSQLTVDNLRISEGGGFRVAWNQSTIVSFDYGISEEDHQLFVALGHAF